ncbi:MAG TPA: M14 metallopeptidase family protein [Pricia sp.]|nr:M14 metallopeptidase family protein [Pricia sp.]
MPTRSEYRFIKENSVVGRYVVHDQIERFLHKFERNDVERKEFETDHNVQTHGTSVQGRSIKSIHLGTGTEKILMWSQMHGNESTTTKAVLDLINFMDSGLQSATSIFENCRIAIIPMLNPDGAAAYTRNNANEIDLNRDARQRTQPESVILRQVFEDFRPDYCFNLHDQRTLYNVGDTHKPATISFLAPAHDVERSISPPRTKSMRLIAAMNRELHQYIPGQIGRYDDTFNANCVGDAFQMTGTPTILFEAGHYPGDYTREFTREYIFRALVTALRTIANKNLVPLDPSEYFSIPENEKRFFDIVVLNAHAINFSLKMGSAIGIRYAEHLRNGKIEFEPKIEKTGDLREYFGHRLYNCLDNNDLRALKRLPELWSLLSDL